MSPRKLNPIELVTLVCARELDKEKDNILDNIRGYLIVSRAVIEDENRSSIAKDEKTSLIEMLLGVNLIRYIDDANEDRCSRAEFTCFTQEAHGEC